MKIAAALLILLGVPNLVAAGPIVVEPATAAPLLEIEARGLRTTEVSIPPCGSACAELDPRFLSFRIAIMAGGPLEGTLTVTELDVPTSRPATVSFRGNASPEQVATLRELLAAARIGLEHGGCTVVFAQEVADQPHPTRHSYLLSYEVLWFGQGHRINRFEMAFGSAPCTPAMRDLVHHVFFLPPHGL